VSFQVLSAGGLFSSHWKLNPEEGKVIQASFDDVVLPSSKIPVPVAPDEDGARSNLSTDEDDDVLFSIVTTTRFKGGGWKKTSNEEVEETTQSRGDASRDCTARQADHDEKITNR
jgi:hypothetical protein